MQYSTYSKFYDAVEGDQSQKVTIIEELIKKYHPNAQSLLELACGTGLLLEHLSKSYVVAGIDLSPEMIEVAKKKLPSISLDVMDMTTFELESKFDVILCVYDSMNHLMSFKDWENTIKQVKKHLNKDGIFIFDMNTLAKLEELCAREVMFREFEQNYLIMEVFEDEESKYRWNVKIFEKVTDLGDYKLHEENIYETSFSLSKVQRACEKEFKELSMTSFAGNEVTEKTGRVLFVYKSY